MKEFKLEEPVDPIELIGKRNAPSNMFSPTFVFVWAAVAVVIAAVHVVTVLTWIAVGAHATVGAQVSYKIQAAVTGQ